MNSNPLTRANTYDHTGLNPLNKDTKVGLNPLTKIHMTTKFVPHEGHHYVASLVLGSGNRADNAKVLLGK